MPPPDNRISFNTGKSQEVITVEKEKKKMGRPYTAESPKTNNYRIRMTDEELKKLEMCCEKTGLSKADVIRKGITLVYKEVIG